MGWDKTPWFIGGGAEHSPEVLRAMLFASMGGGEGIVQPGALKARPLNVPGAGLRFAVGGCVITNRSAGAGGQSYAGRMASEETFTGVAGTGSGQTRSNLWIARVRDPQYPGTTAPADPVNAQYIFVERVPGVPAGTLTAAELNLGYPAIELCRVDYPASTSTITEPMIKDLRRFARPRFESHDYAYQPAGDQVMGNDWSWWPQFEPIFRVPSWATHCVASMVIYGAHKTAGGGVIGDIRLEFCIPGIPGQGAIMGTNVWEEDGNPIAHRTVVAVAGEYDCTTAQGMVRSLRVGALRNATFSQADGVLRAVRSSNVVFRISFEERVA